MKYTNFDEFTFRQSVDKALRKVQSILGTAKKNPRLAEDDFEHTYDDKYALAEFVTNTSLAAQLAILEHLGLTPEHLKTVLKWVHEERETVTMHFEAEDGCTFLTEKEVEVASANTTTEVQTETQGSFFGSPSSSTSSYSETKKHRVISKVKEYHWKVHVTYRFKLYKGNDPSIAIDLRSRDASTVLVTSGGQATRRTGGTANNKPIPPIAEKTVHPAVEVQLTWLLQTLEAPGAAGEGAAASTVTAASHFSIDRTRDSCRTPRRNEQVQAAYEFHQSLVHWMLVVLNFFLDRMEKDILAKHSPAKIVLSAEKLEVGTKCQMVGLEKDPSFNQKYVVVKEYLAAADRYRVEPLHAADSLPPSLTIKKANLKVDVLATTGGPLLSRVTVEDIFVPILPLLQGGSVLDAPNANALLDAQSHSMDVAIAKQITAVFPPRQLAKLASQAEAQMLLLCTHWLDLIEHYQNGMNYIEFLLRKQLVQAIGQEIQADDLETFVRFHCRQLFQAPFAPQPFVRAIRRHPRHYPDGIVSIESTRTTGKHKKNAQAAIHTMVRHVPGAPEAPLYIPLNAATTVEMTGDRYLHGWMQHVFESDDGGSGADITPEYRLVARARQFSSFLLMVGTLASHDTFDPKAAIVVHNKDEVIIPILTKVLPTAQEFKDAIRSLSPEQQAFCRAYRKQQLESSVFGVCVVQLKPQLEQLLELPPHALTKEMQLTQQLLALFTEYQIPSALLSFEGDEEASGSVRLAAVKGHVKAVLDVIEAEKEEQLKEEERRAEMRGDMKFLAEGDEDESDSDDDDESGDHAPVDTDTLTSSMVAQASTVRSVKSLKKSKSRSLAAPRVRIAAPPPPKYERRSAPAPAPPSPSAPPTQQPPPTKLPPTTSSTPASTATTTTTEDFTRVPKVLDAKFAEWDDDNALRSTILTTGSPWQRSRQANLLTSSQSTTLDEDAVAAETNKAFDLLDALSRSGTLPVACAELHVIVAVSHCFENDVMGTVVQDNVNPIEKVEKAALIVGSTLFGEESCHALLSPDHEEETERLAQTFPQLFLTE